MDVTFLLIEGKESGIVKQNMKYNFIKLPFNIIITRFSYKTDRNVPIAGVDSPADEQHPDSKKPSGGRNGT